MCSIHCIISLFIFPCEETFPFLSTRKTFEPYNAWFSSVIAFRFLFTLWFITQRCALGCWRQSAPLNKYWNKTLCTILSQSKGILRRYTVLNKMVSLARYSWGKNQYRVGSLRSVKGQKDAAKLQEIERLRFTFTPNGDVNFYHVTKFPPYFPFTLYCFRAKIIMPVLTIGIVWDCFYLLIFYSEKFSTWVWRLPFAVKVNLNLSTNIFYRSSTQMEKIERNLLSKVLLILFCQRRFSK